MELGLLHGFAATAFTWRRLIPELDPMHRVVALERPWVAREGQVTATLGELDRHRLDRPVLIGHSAGAEIAIMTALRQPDRVGGLVLVAPVIGRGAPTLVRQIAALPGTDRVAPALLRAGARFFGPALRATVHERKGVTAADVRGYRDPLLEAGVMEALWTLSRQPSARTGEVDLGRLTQPCLIITGESDRWTNVAPSVPTKQLVLASCGHLPHEEQPQQTAAAINEFLLGFDR